MHEVSENILNGTLEDPEFRELLKARETRFLAVVWSRRGKFVEWVFDDSIEALASCRDLGRVDVAKSPVYREHGALELEPHPFHPHGDTLVVDLASFDQCDVAAAFRKYIMDTRFIVDSPGLVAPFPYHHELRCCRADLVVPTDRFAHAAWVFPEGSRVAAECFNPGLMVVRYLAEVDGMWRAALRAFCPKHQDVAFAVDWVKAVSDNRNAPGWWLSPTSNTVHHWVNGYTVESTAHIVPSKGTGETEVVVVRFDDTPNEILSSMNGTFPYSGFEYQMLRRIYGMALSNRQVYYIPLHLFPPGFDPPSSINQVDFESDQGYEGIHILQTISTLADTYPVLGRASITRERHKQMWMVFFGSSYERKRVGLYEKHDEAYSALVQRIDNLAEYASKARNDAELVNRIAPLSWGTRHPEFCQGFAVFDYDVLE